LAQLARRAMISEGRARALYTAQPSGLPKPDRHDAGGRPLWFTGTIDAWCARTGRHVPEDSLWIFQSRTTTTPAVELQRGLVEVGRGWRRRTMFVIVWDTEHGHLIYLQPVGETGGDHKDWMAPAAAELIEPRWWSTAVVVMPIEEDLAYSLKMDPIANVYHLTTDVADGDLPAAMESVRRWFQRTAPIVAGPPKAHAEWVTSLDLADISAAIGHPIPLWLTDTTTVDNAKQALAYGEGTFIAPDTVTAWPAAQQRIQDAQQIGLAADYPAAFSALAVDAGVGLGLVRTAHHNTPSRGNGWYLVCRPAPPQPPVELEQLLTTAEPVTDLDLVAKNLAELREIERDLTIDDPRGDVYESAVQLLAQQLRQAEQLETAKPFTAIADADLVPYRALWAGPVVDTWRRQLTPTDPDHAITLRRVRRLLEGGYEARQAYRDRDGRYVFTFEASGPEDWFVAEWPTGLDLVHSWTDQTVLAADDSGSVVTLLALTPGQDGTLRADPVPLPPRGGRDAFAYGYGGGTPGTTYSAILRCVLGDGADLAGARRLAGAHDANGQLRSQLWKAISTTKGPLRLPWPQVQLWARADRNAARDNQ